MKTDFQSRYKLVSAHGTLGALILCGLLTACGDADLRASRAKDLADAAMDQVNGTTIVDGDPAQNLETAAVLDRAIAGTIRNDLGESTENFAPMFAVGSIIAKPKDVPEAPVAALVEEDTVYVEDPALLEDMLEAPAAGAPAPVIVGSSPSGVPDDGPDDGPEKLSVERAMPTITLDPGARSRSLADIKEAEDELETTADNEPKPLRKLRSLQPREFRKMEPEERADMRKMARRSLISADAIKAQVDANSVMLDTLSKFGMDGQVSLSREGQMVIQIGADGADPTQFTPAEAKLNPLGFLAIEKAGGCANTANLAMIKADAALATECVIKDLEASGQFEYVEKDYIFENQFARKPKQPPAGTGTTGTTGTTGSGTTGSGAPPPKPNKPVTVTPNDPLWALQWHFKNNGSAPGQSVGGAGFQDFWSRQSVSGSEKVVVAVVDTGLQMQHPDILNSPNLAPGWDMVSDARMGNDGDARDNDPNDPGDMCDPSAPYAEDTFHGTHVAGTIGAAATNNGSGVAGGAWQVKIVPVRALGKCGGRLSDINDAIRWAGGLIPAEAADGTEIWNDNPADIVNLSIGLFGACPASLQDAIDSVTARGVIVVSAAGNARVSTQFYAPGGCNNVISVAAGDARGQIAPYSNFGPQVDILAPGGDLTRDDNADGRPDGVLSTKAAKNCYDPVTGEGVDNCFYAYEQGTSMAAPHVSAALALLKARSPTATPDELRATLMAAMDTRTPAQCAGLCSQYPGTEPIAGSPDMCARPCGGLLNLAKVPALASGGGGRQK
jgi:serine protease